MKTNSKILAVVMAFIMIIGLVPISAFAENDLPATNTDTVVENPVNNTEETTTPSDPGEQPGSDEGKAQGDNKDNAEDEKQSSAAIFTVTFDANGHGTAPEAVTVTEGKLLQKPTDPAEGETASIGDTQYETLQQAIDAAHDGDTVTLICDVQENIVINEKKITIDLNGNIIAGVKVNINYDPAVYASDSEVTIKNGTLRGGRGGGRLVQGVLGNESKFDFGGTLYIESSNVNVSDVSFTKAAGSSIVSIDSTLAVDGCTISGNDAYHAGYYNTIHIEGGSLEMTDTEASSNKRMSATLLVTGGAKAILDGCTIKNNTDGYNIGGIEVGSKDKGELTIKDTVVTGNIGNKTGGIYVAKGKFVMENSAVSGNLSKNSGAENANDINVRSWDAGSYIQQADSMNGDYEHYLWQDKAKGIITTEISSGDSNGTPLTLTATKDNPNDPAAEYDGQSFSTLSAAVNKAIADNAIDKQDKNIKLLKNIADGISIPSGTVLTGTIDIDLGGYTLKGKDLVTPLVSVRGGKTGAIVVHNGKMENGGSASARTGWGGALSLITNDAVKVTFKDLDLKNCRRTSVYSDAVNAFIYLENLNISNSDISDNIWPVVVDRAEEINIKGCIIENNPSAIAVHGASSKPTKLTMEDCEIRDNAKKASTGDHIIYIGGEAVNNQYISYVREDYCDAVIRNTVITNNTTEGTSRSLIYVTKNSTLKLEGCTITDNVSSYSANSKSATIFADGSAELIVNDCEIRRNKAGAAGAIYYGNDWILMEAKNIVVEGNAAAGRSYGESNDVSGGIVLYTWGGMLADGDVAIYNNNVDSVPPSGFKANDVYVGSNAAFQYMENRISVPFIKAEQMKDGDFDFSQKVWKDATTAGYVERPGNQISRDQYLTVTDRVNVSNVAKIEGKGEFATLGEAADAAEPGDIIEIIAEEPNVVTRPVTVTKSITIDLTGHNISREGGGFESSIFVEPGSQVIIRNTPKKERNNIGGMDGGGITIRDGASLVIDDDLVKMTVKDIGDLTVNKVPDYLRVDLAKGKTVKMGDDADAVGKDIRVNLDSETSAKYNSASQKDPEQLPDLVIIENAPDRISDFVEISNIINPRTLKRVKGSDLVLTIAKAVYVDGDNGLDARDGLDPDTAVRTFAVAKRILEKNDLDCIIVVSPVEVSGTQEWDLGGKEMLRYKYNSGNLARVRSGGDLTLTNIVLDGRRYDMTMACGSLVRVDRRGKLTIKDGAVLQNNDLIQNINEEYLRGGAVDSFGDIIMTGGTIRNNKALVGGGIYQSYGTFDFTGGTIEGNETDYRWFYDIYGTLRNKANGVSTGGGVMLGYGAVMNMSGSALISNNTAEASGGGISIGNNYERYTNPYYSSGKITTLNLTGGTIDGNTAGAGGGINVQQYGLANVEGTSDSHVYIINNTALHSAGYIAGGGIYVNGEHRNENYSSGILNIKNVEITKNTSYVDGAGIATCATSETYLRDLEGALIYENEASMSEEDDTPKNNQIALTGRSLMGNTGWMPDLRGDSTVSSLMLGGGQYNWMGLSGKPLDEKDLEKIQEEVFIVSDLTADDPAVVKGKALATVHLIGNSAVNGPGGAIGNNGLVYVGSYRDYTEIGVTKKWTDDVSDKPGSVKVILRQDGAEYASAVLAPDSNGDWPEYVFKKLPVYKLDDKGAQTDEKHVYTVEEDMSYKPDGSDSPMYESFVAEVEKGETTTRPERDTEDPAYAGKTIDTVHYTMTNDVKPEDPIVTVDPPVYKEIKGEEPPYYPTFRFILTRDDPADPMVNDISEDSVSATIKGPGETEFGTIVLRSPGTYTYTVTEEIETIDGWTYDDTYYKIIYEVTKEGSELKASRIFEHYDKAGDLIERSDAIKDVFVNAYAAPPEDGDTPVGLSDPTSPGDGDEVTATSDPESIEEGGVKTGDESMLGAYIALLAAALLGVILIRVSKKQ